MPFSELSGIQNAPANYISENIWAHCTTQKTAVLYETIYHGFLDAITTYFILQGT
jgi:hypothetical protein